MKMMGNDTSEMMNATLAYAAQHGSEIGKEYRMMGESIGKEYKKIEKGATIMNDNSVTMINTTLQTSIIPNATLAYVQEIGMMGMNTKYDNGKY
jgi:hypothetical protein